MSGRDRRAVLVGVTVVSVALLVLRIGPWGWRELQQSQVKLQARADLLARMQADVSSASRLEDSGAVIRRRIAALAPKLLAGGTAAEAAADLGSRLGVAAERYRVRIKRTDPVADSAGERGTAPVVIRAALEADTEGLFKLLEAVAQETTVLAVDELRIAVADPYVAGNQPELLQVELNLRGWYLRENGSK